jgi:hypothetical protein
LSRALLIDAAALPFTGVVIVTGADGRRRIRTKHYFGRFWELIGGTGFPNQVFNDSWVVGFLEG